MRLQGASVSPQNKNRLSKGSMPWLNVGLDQAHLSE